MNNEKVTQQANCLLTETENVNYTKVIERYQFGNHDIKGQQRDFIVTVTNMFESGVFDELYREYRHNQVKRRCSFVGGKK